MGGFPGQNPPPTPPPPDMDGLCQAARGGSKRGSGISLGQPCPCLLAQTAKTLPCQQLTPPKKGSQTFWGRWEDGKRGLGG
jgi:hypothetical protein